MGTAPTLNSTAVGATATIDPSTSSSARPPSQVLSELVTALTTLLGTEVNAENQVERYAEIVKLWEQMTKAQEDIDAEKTRMAALQAQVNVDGNA